MEFPVFKDFTMDVFNVYLIVIKNRKGIKEKKLKWMLICIFEPHCYCSKIGKKCLKIYLNDWMVVIRKLVNMLLLEAIYIKRYVWFCVTFFSSEFGHCSATKCRLYMCTVSIERSTNLNDAQLHFGIGWGNI